MKVKMILSFLAVMGLVVVHPAHSQEAVVEDGKVVKINYTLTIDGQVVESSEGKEPLEYTHGEGRIIPGLSAALEGMKVGDKKNVVIEPEDAYGQVNEQAFQELPKTSFPEDFEAQKGMVIELQNPEGQTLPGIIWEVKDNTILVNFNHPLAGKTLNFDVTIVSIE